MRPAVARLLTLSRQANLKWNEAALARAQWLQLPQEQWNSPDNALRDQEREHWAAGKALWDKLAFEVAELDLIAGHPVRHAAKALLGEHESVGIRLRPAGPCADPLSVTMSKIGSLEQELIAATRIELGVESGPRWRPVRLFRVGLSRHQPTLSRSAEPVASRPTPT
jgi:hypothetical protein